MLGVVNAIPTSIAPAQADHSLDDLLARIDGLHSIEEGDASRSFRTPIQRLAGRQRLYEVRRHVRTRTTS